jgi:hypothetical protein
MYNLIQRLYAFCCILFIPLWTLPILPGLFKPITSIFISILGLPYLVRRVLVLKKLSKPDFFILSYFLLSIIWSCLLYVINDYVSAQSYIAIAMFTLGISSYFGFKYFLNVYGITSFLNLIRIVLLFVVMVGWVDLLSWLSLLPSYIGDALSYFFSGKHTSRLALTTSEPAWACRLISLLAPFAWYSFKERPTLINKFNFYSLILFFIATFSLSGILIVILFICFQLLYRLSFRLVLKSIVTMVFIFGAFYATYSSMKKTGGYFVTRIDKVFNISDTNQLFTLEALSKFDGSAFIRIGYPIMSFDILSENLIGVGLGNYGNKFSEYIVSKQSFAMNNSSVAEHVKNKNADQRNYLSKLMTDNGMFLFVLIFLFYFSTIKRLLKMIKANPNNTLLNMLLYSAFLMFANMLQFASYLFISYWLIPALINYLYENGKIDERR